MTAGDLSTDEVSTTASGSRREFLKKAGVVAASTTVGASWLGPAVYAGHSNSAAQHSSGVLRQWVALALSLAKTTAGFSPPVVARALAYLSVGTYEALLGGLPSHRSLAGQLNGLGSLPAQPKKNVDWRQVANAASAELMRGLFTGTTVQSQDNLAAIAALENRLSKRFSKRASEREMKRSTAHARRVAGAVLEWASSDGGHEAYLRNFPSDYVAPTGPGLWVPTAPAFSSALQPYWGSNRPMWLATGAEVAPADPPPYATAAGNVFFDQALEVHDVVNSLTEEQRTIALYWADNPGETFTPPGHSFSVMTQLLDRKGASLAVAAERYARLGIAINDAFISCWHAKYVHNVVRPITYIQEVIDPAWGDQMPVSTPPFPEYTSGHSVQSGAAEVVLTDAFGAISFRDRSHVERGYAPRRFDSFTAMAEEAAVSRLYGGIHYRFSIDLGLDQGREVGQRVLAIDFKR